MEIRNEMVSLMRMCARWLCSFNIMRRILPEFGSGTRTRPATFFVRTIATVLFIIAPPVDWNASFIVTLKRASIAVEAWWDKIVKTRKHKSVSTLFPYVQYNLAPRVSLPQENAGNEVAPGRYWGETTNGRSLSVARGFYWNSSLSFTLALKHFPQTSWHWKGAPEICCQSISAWRLYSCCILARFPTIACPAAALYMKLNCTGRPFHKYADIFGIFRILLLI